MSEEANEAGHRSNWWVWLWLLAVPVLYVLSAGPAALIVDRTGSGEEVAEVVYAPLIWLERNTVLKEPPDAYVDFWKR